MVEVNRPFLMSDLFYMKNWYLVGEKKNAVSDGTIDGQAGGEASLLPMLPMQFLVVRNVKISSTDWGSDGQTMSQMFGDVGGGRGTAAAAADLPLERATVSAPSASTPMSVTTRPRRGSAATATTQARKGRTTRATSTARRSISKARRSSLG